ncbi:MAG: hypothetical protein Q7S14_00720 [bacterium]|nr:hypothetical protein [bacterium]
MKSKKIIKDPVITLSLLKKALTENNKTLIALMDKRFDGVNEQFKGVNERIGRLDIRFGNFEDRVDTLENNMNVRFNKVDADIEEVYNGIQQALGTTFSLLDEKFDPRVGKLEKHVFPNVV